MKGDFIMGEKYNDPRNKNQIFKKYGKNCFMEILGPTPEFAKVTFHFVNFNGNTKKITDEANHYISIPDMLTFYRHVSHGLYVRNCEECKSHNQMAAIWKKQGGTPARNGSMATARIISMLPATKIKQGGVIFKSEVGFGNEDKSGLIMMDYSKNVQNILVGMSYEDLYGMAEYIKMRLQAYTNWMQSNGYYGAYTGIYNGDTTENTGEISTDEIPDDVEETTEDMWENLNINKMIY